MIKPAWSAVRSIEFFTESHDVHLCLNLKLDPTGGAGVALPAGICNLTSFTTFLATRHYLLDCFVRGLMEMKISPPTVFRHVHFHALWYYIKT